MKEVKAEECEKRVKQLCQEGWMREEGEKVQVEDRIGCCGWGQDMKVNDRDG